jgi:hypothetical protein
MGIGRDVMIVGKVVDDDDDSHGDVVDVVTDEV